MVKYALFLTFSSSRPCEVELSVNSSKFFSMLPFQKQPMLRKDLQSICLDHLLWIAQIKKDPIHKQIIKTKDALTNEDYLNLEEAFETALDKRKFLMKSLFGDTHSTNTF